MHIFNSPKISKGLHSLSKEESFHAVKVLRIRVGDEVNLMDGKGTIAKAKIVEANASETKVEVLELKLYPQKNYQLHIAIAPNKSMDRFEWFLEKATELGISEITPIYTQRTIRTKLRFDRLEKILMAAMKQSMNPYLPKLNEAIDFKSFFQNIPADTNKLIAHCMDGEKLSLKTAIEKSSSPNFICLIGPEGDFTPDEVQMTLDHNFQTISLGEDRLRTETAAVFVLAGLKVMKELL
jgi:16S rRNA (uracil1498-N3)-methyltransferase